MKKELVVKNINVSFFAYKEEDYISLTDIAKYKNSDDPRFPIQNWMRTHATVEFIGLWEIINNPDFNRLEFDTVKNQAGSNAFVLTPKKWVTKKGFTHEELDFIINYDIKYRMGKKLNSGEDNNG